MSTEINEQPKQTATPVKMVMDEVGADIEAHGFVPVTADNATLSPFTPKGSLATALDEAIEQEGDENKAPISLGLKDSGIRDVAHLKVDTDPLILEPSLEGGYDHDARHDQRNEVEGDVEGTDMPKPKTKETLAAVLDSMVMDTEDAANQTEHEEQVQEENLKKVEEAKMRAEVPKIPKSMGGGDETDEHGLVYITRIFKIDPDKYFSANYRPLPKDNKDAAKIGKKVSKPTNEVSSAGEESLSDLGTPEAKASAASPTEPTAEQEAEAAKNANKALSDELSDDKKQDLSRRGKHENDVESLDEAVAMDCATVYDDSSYFCFDEPNGIDFAKVAMDARPHRAPTRRTCETTFAQCRAENPLFCRFHGPKLLEADMKGALRAMGVRGSISVTKVPNMDNAFKVTIGCAPQNRQQAELCLRQYMQLPGVTPLDERVDNGRGGLAQEFQMDLLRADEPPTRGSKEEVADIARRRAVAANKTMPVVQEEGAARPRRQRPPRVAPTPASQQETPQTQPQEQHAPTEAQQEVNTAPAQTQPSPAASRDNGNNPEITDEQIAEAVANINRHYYRGTLTDDDIARQSRVMRFVINGDVRYTDGAMREMIDTSLDHNSPVYRAIVAAQNQPSRRNGNGASGENAAATTSQSNGASQERSTSQAEVGNNALTDEQIDDAARQILQGLETLQGLGGRTESGETNRPGLDLEKNTIRGVLAGDTVYSDDMMNVIEASLDHNSPAYRAITEAQRRNSANRRTNDRSRSDVQGGQPSQPTSARPTEPEIHRAAAAIANANIDVIDDAFTGIADVLNGTVGALGSNTAEQNTREIAEPYIEALTAAQNNGEDHSNVVRALQEVLNNISQQQQSQEQQRNATSEENNPPQRMDDVIQEAAVAIVDSNTAFNGDEAFRNHYIASFRRTLNDLLDPHAHYWETLPDGYTPESERRDEARAMGARLANMQRDAGHTRFQPLIDEFNRIAGETANATTGSNGGGNAPSAEASTRQPSQQPQRPQTNPTNSNANGIEHLEGGVKARFSPSEKNAIEREMSNAIRISNADPGNLEAQSYAHALSHFLGSRNSSYGRRNNALAGIRDNITKAELLEKAEARLAHDADADHPEKYEGTVRALRKIAELSGIEGLEIDGANITLSDPVSQGARPPAQGNGEGDNAPAEPTEEQKTDATNFLRAMMAGGRDLLESAMNGTGWEQVRPSRQLEICTSVIDTLGRDPDGDHSAVVARIQRHMDDIRGRMENAAAAARTPQNAPAQANPPEDNAPPSQASNEVRQPTEEEVESAASRLASTHGFPVRDIRRHLDGYLNGTAEINSSHLPVLASLPEDDPVRRALNRRWEEQQARRAEAARQAEARQRALEEDAPPDNDIENLSVEEARSRIPQPRRDVTREEVIAAREADLQWWSRGPSQSVVDQVAIAANTTGLSRAVKTADAAVQRAAMPGCRKFRSTTVTSHDVFNDSQIRSHGCNCWKAVAGVLLRLRGFKVKARGQYESSPVFAGTNAEDGQQRLTFIESQTQMHNNYERVNERSRAEAIKHLERIAYGSDGSAGNPPSLPYPDGTFISTWNGGHCTGAILIKGRFYTINPYYGSRIMEQATIETICSQMDNVGGSDYAEYMRNYVRQYKEDKDAARNRGERYQLPDHSEKKVYVLHYLNKRRELMRTNPQVTDEEVITACANDDTWLNYNGSYVVRPDEPLIPALFGLCKTTTT